MGGVTPRDLVDSEPDYVRRRDMSPWEALVREVFDRSVLVRRIPAEGMCVELGTARGRNFARLCALFGPERCLGFDVVDDAMHPRIRAVDVRRLGPDDDVAVALGWNDLSDWALSPASKRAGQAFLLRNVIVGGLYVDAGFTREAPPPRVLAGFEHVASDRGIEVWRRLVGGPELARAPAAGPHTPDPAWWQWLDRCLQISPVACRVRGGPSWGAGASPAACAAAFLRGASALAGRLRACEGGGWLLGASPAGPGASGVVVLAGPEPRRLTLAGDDGDFAVTLAAGDVAVVPARLVAAGTGEPGRAAWRVGFVHEPAAAYVGVHARPR